MSLVNLIAADIILFVKDLAKTFEVFVRIIDAKMVYIKNILTIVRQVMFVLKNLVFIYNKNLKKKNFFRF